MVGLENLDSRQIEAVTHRYGPIRVIAGPGAGKTRVLAHRVAYLISAHGISPGNILAVTFTRKAAREIRERVNTLLTANTNGTPHISTFHSLGLSILKAERIQLRPGAGPFKVLDEGKKLSLIKDMLGPKGLNLEIAPGLVATNISRWKAAMLRPGDLCRLSEGELPLPARRQWTEIYYTYEDARVARNMLDYDDLLLYAYELLSEHPSVLKLYQDRFVYVLVDEFHDTDPLQWELTRLLAAPQNNLMAIFDEDQNIYSWRGARPDYCLDFRKYFPDVATVKLEQNYRSTQTIVRTASRLIAHNTRRSNKHLWSARQPGVPIEILQADNPYHEAGLIIHKIQSLRKKDIGLQDIAVLYRTNAQSRALEDECIRHRIPYAVVGSLGFYDRREIKDMLAFLRLVRDPADDEALLRVVNIPNRYLGRGFIQELQAIARSRNTSLFDQLGVWDFPRPYMVRNSQGFKDIILGLHMRRRQPLATIIRDIRLVTEYDRYIVEDEECSPDDSRLQNLEELCDAALQFDCLEDFLLYVEGLHRQRKQAGDTPDAISLMTIHKAKGLEFRAVFLAGCAQGLLPHHKSLHQGSGTDTDHGHALEEERRVCYVAVTRAKERLYLSYPQWRRGQKMEPSIFLGEMEISVD